MLALLGDVLWARNQRPVSKMIAKPTTLTSEAWDHEETSEEGTKTPSMVHSCSDASFSYIHRALGNRDSKSRVILKSTCHSDKLSCPNRILLPFKALCPSTSLTSSSLIIKLSHHQALSSSSPLIIKPSHHQALSSHIKLSHFYEALIDGWTVEMIPGKTSNVFQLTGRVSFVERRPNSLVNRLDLTRSPNPNRTRRAKIPKNVKRSTR